MHHVASADPDDAGPDERRWQLTMEGERFVDAKGRTVQLRAINLPCKVPHVPHTGQRTGQHSRPLAMHTGLEGGTVSGDGDFKHGDRCAVYDGVPSKDGLPETGVGGGGGAGDGGDGCKGGEGGRETSEGGGH